MVTEQLTTVERWGLFELALPGPREGNPFTEVSFGARFCRQHRTVEVDGFYDGDGLYRVRFMPDTLGPWRYETISSCTALAGVRGEFTCEAPSAGNHGPVGVSDRFHFAYADGAPYYQLGTTCYAWVHQGDALEEHTLATLARAPFNKLRMCLFPKHYTYNANEPEFYPFERGADGGWDLTRFSPAYFHHLERRLLALQALGIEADLILFHPYDRWGHSAMPAEADDRYLRYVVARLAAFRNVWWSLANEYDLMTAKSMADWDRFFRIVQENDPYQHLRSVHNCRGFYDYAKPWVTHQSIQHRQVENTRLWREQYGKPVVIDECQYEGNIPEGWGNLAPQEMVRKFWEGTVRGGYVGHGETYLHPQDLLWWSKGGELRGASPPRLAFLREIIASGPACGWDPVDGVVGAGFPCVTKREEAYLTYFGMQQPALVRFRLPAGRRYRAEILETWDMTRTPVATLLAGDCELALPTRIYQAVLLRAEDGA